MVHIQACSFYAQNSSYINPLASYLFAMCTLLICIASYNVFTVLYTLTNFINSINISM